MKLLLILLTVTTLTIGRELTPMDDDVFDGPCRPLEQMKNISNVQDLINLPTVYSVFLASASNIRGYAAAFLGRYAHSQKELERMCYNFMWTKPLTFQTGYVTQTFIDAGPPGGNVADSDSADSKEKCVYKQHIIQSPGVEMKYQWSNRETLIWSDGENHGLWGRCMNHEYMDWKLVSRAPLTDDIKDVVLKVVAQYGFNVSHAVDMRDAYSANCWPEIPTIPQAMIQVFKNFKMLPACYF